MKFELSNVYQEWLEKMIEQNQSLVIQESLQDIYAADISSVLYELNAEKSKYRNLFLDLDIHEETLFMRLIENQIYTKDKFIYLKRF